MRLEIHDAIPSANLACAASCRRDPYREIGTPLERPDESTTFILYTLLIMKVAAAAYRATYIADLLEYGHPDIDHDIIVVVEFGRRVSLSFVRVGRKEWISRVGGSKPSHESQIKRVDNALWHGSKIPLAVTVHGSSREKFVEVGGRKNLHSFIAKTLRPYENMDMRSMFVLDTIATPGYRDERSHWRSPRLWTRFVLKKINLLRDFTRQFELHYFAFIDSLKNQLPVEIIDEIFKLSMLP